MLATELSVSGAALTNILEHSSGDFYYVFTNSSSVILYKSTAGAEGPYTPTTISTGLAGGSTYCDARIDGDVISYITTIWNGSDYDHYEVRIDVSNNTATNVGPIITTPGGSDHKPICLASNGDKFYISIDVYTSMGQSYNNLCYLRKASGNSTWDSPIIMLEESTSSNAPYTIFQINDDIWATTSIRYAHLNMTTLASTVVSGNSGSRSSSEQVTTIVAIGYKGANYGLYVADTSAITIREIELTTSPVGSMDSTDLTLYSATVNPPTSLNGVTLFYDTTNDELHLTWFASADGTRFFNDIYDVTGDLWAGELETAVTGVSNIAGLNSTDWEAGKGTGLIVGTDVVFRRSVSAGYMLFFEHTITEAIPAPKLIGDFSLPTLVVVGSLDASANLTGLVTLPLLTASGVLEIITPADRVVGTITLSNNFQGIYIDPQDELYFLELDNGLILEVPLIWFTIRKSNELGTSDVSVYTTCSVPESYKNLLDAYIGNTSRIYKSVSGLQRNVVSGVLFSLNLLADKLQIVLKSTDVYGGSVIHLDKLMYMKISSGSQLIRMPPKTTINVGDTIIVESAVVFVSHVVTHISESQSFTEVS